MSNDRSRSSHLLRVFALGFSLALAGNLAALLPGSALAVTIFDNFDGGGGFHPEFNLAAASVFIDSSDSSTVRSAAQFTVTGGSFLLDSITLPISVQKNVPDDILRVRLTADAGGAPGTTLEVLSEDEGIWPNFTNPFTTTTTLTSTTQPLLLDGTSYWIVAEPTAIPAGSFVSVDFRWFDNTSGTTVPARQQQTLSGALPSDPWPGSSSLVSLAFRVEGTPVPEPSTALLLGSGLVGLASLRRRSLR